MMQIVVDNVAAMLSLPPDPVLPAANIGVKKPATLADIPAICLGLELDGLEHSGIGRLVRSGEAVVKNTALVVVSENSEIFSPDLLSLRLSPVPLRKNPSSSQMGLNAYEVQVTNISDPAQPLSYQLVLMPIRAEEYALDPRRARLVFGRPLTKGDTLEVTHWTVSWRDDILLFRCQGQLSLEIWGLNYAEVNSISHKLQTKLAASPGLWRRQGFLRVCPSRFEPAENSMHVPTSGSSFSVWKQRLTYGFAFEAEEGAELSSGLPIKKVLVDMDQELPEKFTVV